MRPFACALMLASMGVLMSGALAQVSQGIAAAPVLATGHADAGPAWNSLSNKQRSALAPLVRDWASIDANQKAKWLEVASRFPKMPADERRRVQARMAEWARLSPAERTTARMSFQEIKQIPRQEKQARWEAYRALTPEQRQALAERREPVAAERTRGPAAAVPIAIDVAQPKQNLVPRAAASARLVKPVAPMVVQARPGATTTLMTQRPTRPPHQMPGQPKIAAWPTQVDRSTMLPKTGPQAAAPVSAASAPQ